jgi:hypothetical protein
VAVLKKRAKIAPKSRPKKPRTDDGNGDLVARNIEQMLKHLDCDRDDPAPLVASPSAVTLEAIKIVRPWLLHGLLCIRTLTLEDHNVPVRESEAWVCDLECERERWLRIEQSLSAARKETGAALHRWITNAGGIAEARGQRHQWLDDIRDLDAMIKRARAEADGALTLVSGSVSSPRDLGEWQPHPVWNERVRAQADAPRSPKDAWALARARAKLLKERLGWEPPRLADLIVASQHDWTSPPITLDPSLSGDPVKIGRRLAELLRPIRRR